MPAVDKPAPLVIPPKEWRGVGSLHGYAIRLRAEIAIAERTICFQPERSVRLKMKTAKALLEIVCQAIHTEQGHGV